MANLVAVEVEASVSGNRQTTLRVAGELDLPAVAEFDQAVRRAFRPGVRRVVIDLSGLRFIDATGIGALLSAWRRATNEGRALGFTAPSPAVWRVLSILDLTTRLPIEIQN